MTIAIVAAICAVSGCAFGVCIGIFLVTIRECRPPLDEVMRLTDELGQHQRLQAQSPTRARQSRINSLERRLRRYARRAYIIERRVARVERIKLRVKVLRPWA